MPRFILTVAALASALTVAAFTPAPAMAQSARYTGVECSQNITGVGRRAARADVAVNSAIDAFNAEARRLHGARTNFTYQGGEALFNGGRLSLTCQRQTGLVVCEARGRTCAWASTTTPNTQVASRCPDGFIHGGSSGTGVAPCGATERREGRNLSIVVVQPRTFTMPGCPQGYTLDRLDTRRCLRG